MLKRVIPHVGIILWMKLIQYLIVLVLLPQNVAIHNGMFNLAIFMKCTVCPCSVCITASVCMTNFMYIFPHCQIFRWLLGTIQALFSIHKAFLETANEVRHLTLSIKTDISCFFRLRSWLVKKQTWCSSSFHLKEWSADLLEMWYAL